MTRIDPPVLLAELLAHHERAVAAIKTTIALAQTGRGAEAFDLAIQAAAFDGRVVTAPKKAAQTMTKTARRRARIRRKLNAFSTKTVRPGSGHGLGPLVAAGYLKRKGGGYLRTDKVYA